MEIVAESIYKRFLHTWIIRDFNFRFHSKLRYGVAGLNGVGKSTLLQMLAGIIPVSKGKIKYIDSDKVLEESKWYEQICFAAPYAELYDYMNISELVNHHLVFKKFQNDLRAEEFIRLCYLQGHENKLIKSYSSGMKQRLKLGLSIISESKVLFLDEPQSNLDELAKSWYRNILDEYTKDKIVIIASNENDDFNMVQKIIRLESKVV